MKLIKRVSSTTMIVLLCFFAFNAANAAITWDNFSFSYAVDENSADIYNMNMDKYDPVATLAGDTPQSTNTGGETDPVNSRVNSSSPPDSSGLGLQLKAGAGGQHLSNGVRIDGYVVTSTASGGVLFPYAVGSPGSQKVLAWSNRNFHVDGNQAATLFAVAGGVPNDPGFSEDRFLFADYDWEGGVWLDEIVTLQDVPLVQDSLFIDFDDLRNNGPQELLVNLRTQDGNGDPVSYTLRTKLDLESRLLNYDFLEEFQAGDIPVGDLGSLGTLDDPLWIGATIDIDPVPIPGSVILLLSGIASVVGLRKKCRS